MLSFGGPDVCPWCDCGIYRDGQRFTYRELMNPELIRQRACEEPGMEGQTRLEPRKLGIYMKVVTPEGTHHGFIPFAPDILDLERDE